MLGAHPARRMHPGFLEPPDEDRRVTISPLIPFTEVARNYLDR